MLRITQNTGGAKSYFSTADYYSEGQELTGRWRGEAARRLGLAGDVKQPEWDALCDNLHPQTGEQLTPRRKTERTVGYDFNYHVPKTVSLLYAMTRDERLLDAFRDAVDGTMHDIESEMRTRVRKRGKNEDRITGNMAWGEFVHFTSRPVEGIPDPHLHAHCFVFNTTFDEKEAAWKAGQFRELKRDAPYFEAVFHSRLAHRLADLGLPIERTKKGWELGGISNDLVDKFSRRTAEIKVEIDKKEEEKGPLSAADKAEIGARTRERKQKYLTFPELQQTWRSWMSADELSALAALERRIGGDSEPTDHAAAARAMEHALSHSFERKSVVPERQVLATALRQAVGKATVEQVVQQADRSGLIVGERDGRRMATTREVLLDERRVVSFAKNGRGTCPKIVAKERVVDSDRLNAEQKKAARHVLESRDRVILLTGKAGVGKTTLMKETVAAIEEGGTKVFAFAPSAAASRGVLRDEGFEADTVARLLIDEKLQQQVAGQRSLIWIDEAGLLGMKTLAKVFDLAEKIDARVLLTGDRFQHGAVQREGALRLLEIEAGLKPAEVKEIQRQKGEYKDAVKAMSEGRTMEGFDRLDKLGWVKEIPEDERYRQLAADYVAAVKAGKSALCVSPTHAEAARITREIRQALRQLDGKDGEKPKRGAIGADEQPFRVLQNANFTEAERGDAVNYQPGDVLQYHQNAKGFFRGDRFTVTGSGKLPVDQAARFQVFRTKELEFAPGDMVRVTHNGKTADGLHKLNNGSLYRIKQFDDSGNIILHNGWLIGRDFGHLAHGYVVTSHASQGRTVDKVFIGQSFESYPASSPEQFYVSCSRARDSVTLYVDDKESMRQAISRPDERVTATEFVNGRARQQAVALRQRSAMPQEKSREHKAIEHDREHS